jgi:hypothetical protein
MLMPFILIVLICTLLAALLVIGPYDKERHQ